MRSGMHGPHGEGADRQARCACLAAGSDGRVCVGLSDGRVAQLDGTTLSEGTPPMEGGDSPVAALAVVPCADRKALVAARRDGSLWVEELAGARGPRQLCRSRAAFILVDVDWLTSILT